MTLEKKLVRLRKKEGMSQADVSEKLNVSRQAVSRWEAGDSRPSIENLQALCKLYNVKLDDLLDESNEEVPIEMDEDFTYWRGKLAIHTTFIIWTTEKEKNL